MHQLSPQQEQAAEIALQQVHCLYALKQKEKLSDADLEEQQRCADILNQQRMLLTNSTKA